MPSLLTPIPPSVVLGTLSVFSLTTVGTSWLGHKVAQVCREKGDILSQNPTKAYQIAGKICKIAGNIFEQLFRLAVITGCAFSMSAVIGEGALGIGIGILIGLMVNKIGKKLNEI